MKALHPPAPCFDLKAEPAIYTCAGCGYLRYREACAVCADKPDKPAAPLRPMPPVIAPEPHRDPPAALPERRPPGREICDPLPRRKQASFNQAWRGKGAA